MQLSSIERGDEDNLHAYRELEKAMPEEIPSIRLPSILGEVETEFRSNENVTKECDCVEIDWPSLRNLSQGNHKKESLILRPRKIDWMPEFLACGSLNTFRLGCRWILVINPALILTAWNRHQKAIWFSDYASAEVCSSAELRFGLDGHRSSNMQMLFDQGIADLGRE